MARLTPPPRSFSQSIIAHDRLDVGQRGHVRHWYDDLYHRSVRLGWPAFFGMFALVFFALNLVFAVLYACDPAGLKDVSVSPESSALLRGFFFSVHTIATVGYGNIYPVSLYTNVIVVIEIAFGILVFALTSGLAFARFSIPTARILFSDVAVVRMFEGYPTLMFRAANQRNNLIVEASVRLSILRTLPDGAGELRRFFDLSLLRASSPVFAMTWLVMHRIDESSPLYGMSQEQFDSSGDDLVVLMTGLDSSVSQPISARHAYGQGKVLWDHHFVDIMSADEAGRRWIDYTHFHATIAVGEG